ncbi:MAG: hypothetical protein KDK37_17275 [Leptospiraceae bacterium]|nr:hypothetical protein [Leptospiraceae bacterium]
MSYLEKAKAKIASWPEKYRAAFYLFPLMVLFLPGILLDSGRPYRAAVRGLVLSLLFWIAAFLIYFLHYYIWHRSADLRYIRDLFFFLAHLLIVVAYVGVSLYLCWLEWNDNHPENIWIDRTSRQIVRFLEFKA